MARLLNSANIVLASAILLLASNVLPISCFTAGPLKNAHATFYGSEDGSGATGGACGYADTRKEGFGLMTTALSVQLFNDAAACGSCYEITCDPKGTKWCKPGNKPITVTATDLCPDGGWCAPPKEHFDLSQPAFLQIAEKQAGVVPVLYRRVSCARTGGIRLTIEGNPNFNLVSVSNVAGAGDVVGVEVRGGKKLPWTKLKRNWGQKWETDVKLIGRKLSFRVTTSDNQSVILYKVTEKNWQFGQTFQTKYNLM